MPQLPEYTYTGPLDCNIEVDTSNLKGKSVIVTGGANGIGEQYVRVFVKAGAFVTFGDIDEAAGQKLAAEFPENAHFTRCDVTKWEDQLTLFKEAISASPSKSCDIVIANAGIAVSDDILEPEDSDEPTKPSLLTTEINVIGVLYTIKLARFYFNKQVDSEERDRCLILQGSIAGYIDQPGVLQYNGSKFHLRGMMRTLRRMAHLDHIRVNLIAPWYIRTNIIGDLMEQALDGNDVPFAETADAADAVLRIATDRSVTGHSLAILPRKYAPKGFVDMDYDDYEEGELLDELTKLCVRASPFLNPPKL